jgi:hypothetical protein
MMTSQSFSRAAMVSVALVLTSINAQAELPAATAVAPAPAPAATPTPAISAAPVQAPTTAAESASSFDSYRVLAVTAGVIGGAVVATVLTDGLILPAYCWATGGTLAEMGAGGGMAAGAGLGNGAGARVGAGAFRGVMQTLGAVGGGFYTDSWYR